MEGRHTLVIDEAIHIPTYSFSEVEYRKIQNILPITLHSNLAAVCKGLFKEINKLEQQKSGNRLLKCSPKIKPSAIRQFKDLMEAQVFQVDPNVLKVNKSSDEMARENYKKAISELKKTGFTNIKTKVLDDLITGWLTKDGEIEKIEINGDTKFSANDSFRKDSKIVITYHTFPKREKRDIKATDEKSSEKSDTNSTDKKSSETTEQSTNDTSAKSNQEILTVKNNADLAAVLAVKDEFDPIVGEFAKKYASRTIEFDGNIANMMQHGDYTTRYDILIYAGDYSETTAIGPSFKFENVNVSDLKLTGSEIPENIGRGQNLHITAEVEEYNETSGLFFLNPISTEIR